jgi:O-antigen ligase
MKPGHATRRAPRGGRSIGERLLWWIVAGSVVAVPLFYSPSGYDGFRLPKELLLRAAAILIGAAFATIAILDGPRALAAKLPSGRTALLLAAIGAWSLIAAAVSTNRRLSADALIYTATLAVFFLGAYAALAGREPAAVLGLALAGAIPNAILAMLQRTSIWNPFHLDPHLSAHLRTSALLGNANDVGSYLMPVALMAVVWAVISRRAVWWAAAGVAAGGLMASEALSALAAFFAGCLVLVAMLPRGGRAFRVAVAAVLIVAALAGVTVGWRRLAAVRRAIAVRDYPELTSQRIFPFATAWDMFTGRPLTGLGPGTFKYRYLEYRMRFNERNPRWLYVGIENYAQVHNDHLQVLAEEGIGGYLLFLAALTLVGSRGTRREPDGEAPPRIQFARLAALPLTVAFAVLALGGFPLELGAASQATLFFTAAILSVERR